MKLFWGLATLGVLIASYVWFSSLSSPEASRPRHPASEGSYCIALRGNGQSQPAHWGALAKTVEQLGLPSAMAGGSSATISMLWMEAIASHPLVKDQTPELQKQRASLLLKSLLGFFSEVQKTSTWDDIRKLYASYQKVKDIEVLKTTKQQIDIKQLMAAKKIVEQAIDMGLLDPQAVAPLVAALKAGDAARAQFYIGQLKQTAELFGQFKPDDKNIFFRAGLVNFNKAAETFGRIAAFYAADGKDVVQKENWQSFVNTCAPKSQGLTWSEIVSQTPECGVLFHKLFAQHFSESREQSHYENNQIGSQFKVFPTTSVLTGKAVQDFKTAMNDYHQNMNAEVGQTYRVQNPDEVKFGYWGDPASLKQMAQNLDSRDAKSQKFLALGNASWQEVLSLSPAEPGLSSFQEFTTEQGQNYISAGGWSDLHPVLVLKAAGCQDVVYITRTGSESLFAQGMAKRLFGWEKNSNADQASWSALYDLTNPKSSYRQSLAQASAVLCSNWDAFEVPQAIVPLIDDSYRSPFVLNSAQGAVKALAPILSENKVGCTP